MSEKGEAPVARVDDDKEKARYLYRLELRKLIVDKLFLGLILVVLGYVANITIEEYRAKSARDVFLLQKRLEAVTAVRAAYADMFDNFDSFTLLGTPLPKDYRKQYKKSIDAFSVSQNRWSTLFPPEFNAQLEFHLWTHQAFLYRGVAESVEYREFVYDLDQHFDFICRRELGVAAGEKEQIFEFDEWPHEKVEKEGNDKFLAANFAKWRAWRR